MPNRQKFLSTFCLYPPPNRAVCPISMCDGGMCPKQQRLRRSSMATLCPNHSWLIFAWNSEKVELSQAREKSSSLEYQARLDTFLILPWQLRTGAHFYSFDLHQICVFRWMDWNNEHGFASSKLAVVGQLDRKDALAIQQCQDVLQQKG